MWHCGLLWWRICHRHKQQGITPVMQLSMAQILAWPRTKEKHMRWRTQWPEKGILWMMPIIDIIAEHYRFSLFHMDYKWFDVNNLLLSSMQYWWVHWSIYFTLSFDVVRVWYVFLSILLVLENCNCRSLRSPWKVLEFCPFSLLWTLYSVISRLSQSWYCLH